MPSQRVFLDANVVLEVVLERSRHAAARAVMKKHAANLAISTLSAHLIVHFGSSRAGLPVLKELLTDYQLLGLEAVDFDWAFTNAQNNDFEDALQLAVAIRHGCNRFITLDVPLYKSYAELPQITVELITAPAARQTN